MRRRLTILTAIAAIGLAGPVAAEFTRPWDDLTPDSWIGANRLNVYTYDDQVYQVAFDDAKPKTSGDQAAGMKTLKFSHGGATTGRLVGGLQDGFSVINGGNHSIFSTLVFLVAIDAPALAEDFSFSIGPDAQAPQTLGPADFVHYDPSAASYATGRPSGYYSGTDPAYESLAYDFDSGMVTVVAVSGLDPLGFPTNGGRADGIICGPPRTLRG